MYPMRYTSPTNMTRKQTIDEEESEEEEDEEYDEDEEDQEDDCASRVTRF